jgi:hypothetical protein
MSADIRTRERRIRRIAASQGLRLCKNRREWIRGNFGDQYHLVNGHNIVVLGATTREYDANLSDVEDFLMQAQR